MRIARFSSGGEVSYGVVRDDEIEVMAGHPLLGGQPTGERQPVDAVRLVSPVVPTKIVAIGKNYADHATEMGGEVPAQPLIFLKPPTAVIGPGDRILSPPSSERVDFEGELAVVIGAIGRDVPEEHAMSLVFGYTCANDVTARDQQKTDGQWSRAKGYDTFCPLGPWIETEVDPSDLRISTSLNGEVKQDSRTSKIVHGVSKLISYISSCMSLLPGDVILTGTPEGVGPMRVGDEVSVEIEGIGRLSNPVDAR